MPLPMSLKAAHLTDASSKKPLVSRSILTFLLSSPAPFYFDSPKIAPQTQPTISVYHHNNRLLTLFVHFTMMHSAYKDSHPFPRSNRFHPPHDFSVPCPFGGIQDCRSHYQLRLKVFCRITSFHIKPSNNVHTPRSSSFGGQFR